MKFNEYLKSLRKNKKLTQIELANLSGVSKSHVSRIEIDDNSVPKPDTLRKLAPALGVTYEHLMYKAGYYEGTIEHEFIEQLHLDDENITKRYKFVYGDKELTDIEIKTIIALLKAGRGLE